MEVVSNIAREGRHLIVRSKLAHADGTFFVLFKIFFIVFHFDHTIEHLELLTLLLTRRPQVFFNTCDDTWQAANTNQKYD